MVRTLRETGSCQLGMICVESIIGIALINLDRVVQGVISDG